MKMSPRRNNKKVDKKGWKSGNKKTRISLELGVSTFSEKDERNDRKSYCWFTLGTQKIPSATIWRLSFAVQKFFFCFPFSLILWCWLIFTSVRFWVWTICRSVFTLFFFSWFLFYSSDALHCIIFWLILRVFSRLATVFKFLFQRFSCLLPSSTLFSTLAIRRFFIVFFFF